MKVVAVNGSPRKGGNTEQLIRIVFEELEAEGIQTELIQVGGKLIHGCKACFKCAENLDEKCVIANDEINECVQKLKDADGIILGSPTYFANVTSELKAFIDRVGMVSRVNGCLFARKPAAAVIAVRRSGEVHAFNSINNFFLIGQMIVVGSSYWNNAHGRGAGEVLNDEEGVQTMRKLGKNMAWLLRRING